VSKWRKALGLGDKKVEQSLTQLSSIDQADLNLLVEPSAEQPMVGHAQQHSALTRLAKETSTDLVEVGATVDRNTADIDDISEFLGAVYFEVSLGKERWTFDTQAVPAEGNFTAFSYLFDEYNTEFWINKIPAGFEKTGFESARPGDKMQIEGQGDKTDFGDYVITSILLDNDNVWQVQGDFVEGNGRLTAGRNYEIEIIHVSQQFEKKRKDGSPQIASTDYVDAGDELKLDISGGDITGKLSVFDEIFLNGGNGKQNINAKEGYAGKLKYDGTEKLSWGGNEVVVKNSDLSMDYNRIKKVALPVEDTDAASKKYVDSTLADNGVGGENHSEEISALTKRVDNNSDNIFELRKNDEYFAEGSRDKTTTYKKNTLNPQQKWATTSNSESVSYLTFGGNENLWEHEWKTDTPAKMIFNFNGNRVLEINSTGVLINGSPSIQANTIFESIKDSSNFDEFKEALLTRISTEGIDKDE
jgi:hypothetical protein